MEAENNPKEIPNNEYLNLFKNALIGDENDSLQVKLYSITRLASVAKVIGPEETCEELLPYILFHIESLEYEILYNLSEELELFLPLVGGQEHAEQLFTILLKISRTVDETAVRRKSIEVIKRMLSKIDEKYVEKYVVSYLAKIEEKDEWFSEKCSTISLIPVCYAQASPESKTVLRQKYFEVFEDTSTLIRKLACQELPDFIKILEIEHVLGDVMPILERIEESDQECVKLFIPEITMSIAKKSGNMEIRNDLLQIILRLSESESWRIRQKIAEIIDQIVATFADEEFQLHLLEVYENLINDAELEVRTNAVKNMYKFMKNLRENQRPDVNFDEFFKKHCMAIILFVTADENANIQIAFSTTILSLSKIISKECFMNSILPIVVDGLEREKPLLYKENIFVNLENLPDDVDLIKSLSSINAIIQNILVNSENSWRTRRSLLLTFIHVSKFCNEEFFKENLLIYFIILLKDNVFAVRRTAAIILPILAKRFGMKWLANEMLPQIHITLQHEKYLIRYVILFCIQELMQPSIYGKCIPNYIEDFKELMNTNQELFGRKLCKIIKLNKGLKKNLQDEPFNNILNSYNDENNIHGENITIYSEELLENIQQTKMNVFSIEDSRFDREMCYLEGILILFNKDVLNVLKILMKDPITNVQDRAKYILSEIQKFSVNLNDEIDSKEWVQRYIGKIEENIWNEIDIEISHEIEEMHNRFESVEKIDTDLIDIESVAKKLSRHSIDSVKSLENIEIFPKDYVMKPKKGTTHS